MALTNTQIERAAELLDQIDRNGRELQSIVNAADEYHGIDSAMRAVTHFANESLGLDESIFITPAQMAANLRKTR